MKQACTIILLTLAALGAFRGAATVQRELLAWRTQRHGDPSALPANTPPLMVFTTVALGGFRGILADMLWMRATGLQHEGKVIEIMQLADWITKLEPHLTTAWAFHAWNMAYNISILFPDPESRWRWVQNGIRLLRDEGLKFNPEDPDLYRELGWIYQHKIGFFMDQTHKYYKQQLAAEMTALFNGPRPDYAKAASDPGLCRLRDEYKLLPEEMELIDREYGPLDWRLPESHAIYWACRGRRALRDQNTADPAKLERSAVACEQMIFQSMADEFRQGGLDYDPRTGAYLATPNFDILPKAIRTYEEAVRQFDLNVMHVAFANFLAEATLILHLYGHEAQARETYNYLLAKYPALDPGKDFENFIAPRANLSGDQISEQDVMAYIEGFLFQAYVQLAQGNDKQAAGFDRQAQEIWRQYMRRYAQADYLHLPALALIRRQAFRRALAAVDDMNMIGRLKTVEPRLDDHFPQLPDPAAE